MIEFNSLTEVLKESSLEEVLAQTLTGIKSKPDNHILRDLLFKLYCVNALWEKALLQLETLSLVDNENKVRTEIYKNLVMSELAREEVLAGNRDAVVMGDALPEWVELLQQANKHYSRGDIASAEVLRMQAFEQAPASAGNGDKTGEFAWLAGSARFVNLSIWMDIAGFHLQIFSQ